MNYRRLIYWILLAAFLIPLAGTGVLEVLRIGPEGAAENLQRLGFPLFILPFLGGIKILGAIALIFSSSERLKDWALAGFTFLLSGAVVAHLHAGDGWMTLVPLSLLSCVAGVQVLRVRGDSPSVGR